MNNTPLHRDLDCDFVRGCFPALNGMQETDGKRWAYLENAGGSQLPHQVSDKLNHFYKHSKIQPGGPAHPAQLSAEAMEQSRRLLAASINAAPAQIQIGPSTSYNTYVLAQAIGERLRDGDEIIVTNQDHEANIGVWRRLAARGATIREWRVCSQTGLLDPQQLPALLSERTRLLCFSHCSNIAAAINPVSEICRLAHQAGALVMVDGVSWAPHAAIDVQALGVDFYTLSLYKTWGPHLGVLYLSAEWLRTLANQGHYFNDDDPGKRLNPAGPDHAAIACASGIFDYYDALYQHHCGTADTDAGVREKVEHIFNLISAHEQNLMAPLLALLCATPGVRLIGHPEPDRTLRAPTIAFHCHHRSSLDITTHLAQHHIACGHGHFYAPRLLTALGIDNLNDGVVRLSPVHYNNAEEIERTVHALQQVL